MSGRHKWDELPSHVQDFLREVRLLELKHGLNLGSWGGGDPAVYSEDGSQEWFDVGTYVVPDEVLAP